MGKNIIEISGVSKVFGFGEASTTALKDLDLKIEKGEFVAIMGPSGSGKSTLMNIIGLLDRPTGGTYKLDGREVSTLTRKDRAKVRRDHIGFIFQSFNLLPTLTAIENVALPLTYKGMTHVKKLEQAEEFLRRVDLENRQYYMPSQLSGGQVQRVAVARALVNKPSIVLADEPTGNLDTESSKNIMELLSEIHKGGNTIIMVTHNPDLAKYCDRTITVQDGKIKDDGHKKSSRKKKK